MDDGDGCASVSSVYIVDYLGAQTNISTYFSTASTDIAKYTADNGDIYFIYFGTTLNYALPEGTYYLKITMDTNHVYYSDWFSVDCVYCNFAETFVNNSFDTFTVFKTTISSAEVAGVGFADSTPVRTVYLGQSISVIFNLLTQTGATYPTVSIVSLSLGVISNVETLTATGLQELTLITTRACDDAFIRIASTGETDFTTSEILVHTQYACGYVTLSFTNCCNVGDILYEYDFLQTLWIKSDNIEQAYPYSEKGQENGEGKFIPTFRRQEKTYAIRTEILPQYMIDVLQRLKMHDVMTFIDQVGEAFVVNTVDTEHEWQFDDKYCATATITLDLDEAVIAFGCC